MLDLGRIDDGRGIDAGLRFRLPWLVPFRGMRQEAIRSLSHSAAYQDGVGPDVPWHDAKETHTKTI
jgi:hypothetical protein